MGIIQSSLPVPTINNFTEITNDNIFDNIRKIILTTNEDEVKDKLEKYITLNSIDINITNEKGNTILHEYPLKSIINMLIKNNISIDKKNNEGKTALFYSNLDTAKILIENGCDINIRDNSNHNVLYYKSKNYHFNTIKPFLEANIIVDIEKDFEPDIQLHIAVLLRDMNKIKELIDKNIFLVNSYTTVNDFFGKSKLISPLEITLINEFYNEFLYLIKNGANINDPNINYLLTLSKYDHEYSYTMFNELIKLGIDVNRLINGKTILHYYNIYGFHDINDKYVEYLDLLLKNGADIHIKTKKGYLENIDKNRPLIYYDDFGSEALHIASTTCRNIKIFEKLFEYGADPNVQNDYGITPFMLLCVGDIQLNYYRNEIIKLFIDKGSDIYIENSFGFCALDYICSLDTIQKEKIINYLYEKNKIMKIKPNSNEIIYNILSNNN